MGIKSSINYLSEALSKPQKAAAHEMQTQINSLAETAAATLEPFVQVLSRLGQCATVADVQEARGAILKDVQGIELGRLADYGLLCGKIDELSNPGGSLDAIMWRLHEIVQLLGVSAASLSAQKQ